MEHAARHELPPAAAAGCVVGCVLRRVARSLAGVAECAFACPRCARADAVVRCSCAGAAAGGQAVRQRQRQHAKRALITVCACSCFSCAWLTRRLRRRADRDIGADHLEDAHGGDGQRVAGACAVRQLPCCDSAPGCARDVTALPPPPRTWRAGGGGAERVDGAVVLPRCARRAAAAAGSSAPARAPVAHRKPPTFPVTPRTDSLLRRLLARRGAQATSCFCTWAARACRWGRSWCSTSEDGALRCFRA